MSSGYGEIYEKSTQRSELFHHFNVFPNSVREAFSFITSADYDHDKLKIRCEDEMDKGYDNCYVLFCSTCSKDKCPDFIKKFKDHLPENPKIEDIQEHWDELITVAQLPKIMISVDVSSQMTPPLLQALTIDVCSSSSWTRC